MVEAEYATLDAVLARMDAEQAEQERQSTSLTGALVMSGHVAEQPHAAPLRQAARTITGDWWLSLVAGIAWIVVSLAILQFDTASVTTVGVLVGLMFALSAVQNFALAAAVDGAMSWASAIFGGCSSSPLASASSIPRARSRRWRTSSASCSCSSASGG